MSVDLDKLGIPKLDLDNYLSWSQRMQYLLLSKGLWDATQEGGKAYDSKALAIIGLSVEELYLPTLKSCVTAKAAWDALARLHESRSNARILNLKRQLTALRMSDSEPVTKYISRAQSLRDQLQAAGHTLAEDDLVLSVLNGLPKAYSMLVTILENSDARLCHTDNVTK
jgi:hypothetical protein